MLALRVEQNHDVTLRCGLHAPFSEAEVQQRYGSGSGGGDLARTREAEGSGQCKDNSSAISFSAFCRRFFGLILLTVCAKVGV